jgi:hypothetical protein
VEPLLAADKGLRTALAVNQIFVTDADGNVVKTNIMVKIFERIRGQIHCIKRDGESQMKKAVTATASFWYTAWVNAGKPDSLEVITEQQQQGLKTGYKTV